VPASQCNSYLCGGSGAVTLVSIFGSYPYHSPVQEFVHSFDKPEMCKFHVISWNGLAGIHLDLSVAPCVNLDHVGCMLPLSLCFFTY
jgi:hypothetical protein